MKDRLVMLGAAVCMVLSIFIAAVLTLILIDPFF
jgi:hypothetical protein